MKQSGPIYLKHRVVSSKQIAQLDHGFVGVETDLRMTLDGKILIQHDRRVDHPYGRSMWLDRVTLDEVHQENNDVELLENVLKELSRKKYSRFILDLDIKQKGIEREVHRLLEKYHIFDHVSEIIIGSPDVLVLDAFSALSDKYKFGLTFAINDQWDLVEMRLLKYAALGLQFTLKPLIFRLIQRRSRNKRIHYANVYYQLVDEKLVAFLHEQHIKVLAYHARKQSQVERLIRCGVDGIKIANGELVPHTT